MLAETIVIGFKYRYDFSSTRLSPNIQIGFCGIFREPTKEGSSLSRATNSRLADRNLLIGFDLYAA
jgi:hypothetical protein